jgi:hypothetical protein
MLKGERNHFAYQHGVVLAQPPEDLRFERHIGRAGRRSGVIARATSPTRLKRPQKCSSFTDRPERATKVAQHEVPLVLKQDPRLPARSRQNGVLLKKPQAECVDGSCDHPISTWRTKAAELRHEILRGRPSKRQHEDRLRVCSIKLEDAGHPAHKPE